MKNFMNDVSKMVDKVAKAMILFFVYCIFSVPFSIFLGKIIGDGVVTGIASGIFGLVMLTLGDNLLKKFIKN